MFNIPAGIVGVLLALIAIHLVRQIIPESWDNQVLLRLAFLPGTFTYAVDPESVTTALRGLAEQGETGLRHAQLGRYILMNVGLEPWSVLTYGLLHADWTHVGLNGLWLLAFGSPVARRLGSARFLLFLGVTTLAGALAHYATHPNDFQPVIGASAAVSGCMGAALRFMFQPQVPISSIIRVDGRAGLETARAPLMRLRSLFTNRRATAFLAAWFVANILFGIGIVALDPSGAAVAWQAHIGGFLTGLLALPLFDRGLPIAPNPDPSIEPPEAHEPG